MDIVIYTNPETLLHKRKPDYNCWWSMSRPPKNFDIGDKIWFAVKGEVEGYFISNMFDPEDPEKTIEFESNSWVQLEDVQDPYIFVQPFRGFRYKWW